MREITEKIYTFNELSEDAKLVAMDDYRECWMDDRGYAFREMFLDELDYRGFSELEPYYSLCYCQGDGCCVEGKISIKEVLEKNKEIREQFSESEIRRLKYIEESMWYSLEIRHSGNYYNIHYMHIHSDVENYDWIRDGELLEEVMEKLGSVIEEYLGVLCKEMEEDGYSMIYDDEGLKDYLSESGFEYYENGTSY